jgi:hypothetical protein
MVLVNTHRVANRQFGAEVVVVPDPHRSFGWVVDMYPQTVDGCDDSVAPAPR